MSVFSPIEWRFVICDLDGNYLSILDGLADDVQFTFRMNRSAVLSFNVPSEDPRVNIIRGGHPYLDTNRIIKAFRKPSTGLLTNPGGWVLRYVGRVWTLEDQGDGDLCTTQVTCYDSLKYLEKRIVRGPLGGFRSQVKFIGDDLNGEEADQIVKTMLDRTRTFAGPVGIENGTFVTCAKQVGFYDQAYIMDALVTLTDTGTIDLDVDYLNTFNGVFLRLGAKPRLGTNKESDVVFSYAMPPNTATNYQRVKSLDTLANSIYMFGKSNKGHEAHAADLDSQAAQGAVFESVETISDIETPELLDALAGFELQLRKDPRDLISVTPTPEQSARPWDDYFLGDSVSIQASDPSLDFPVTREEVTGVQRLYGFTLAVDNDYGEKVTDLVVSPQDA